MAKLSLKFEKKRLRAVHTKQRMIHMVREHHSLQSAHLNLPAAVTMT